MRHRDAELAKKVELVFRADKAARAYDPRVKEVRASYADELRRILVIGSDGTFAEDVQPLSRMSVFVIARDGQISAKGTSGGGGRHKFEVFLTEKTPEHFALEGARQAILQLNARYRPGGRDGSGVGPAGRECCCTKQSDTGWRRTSTAQDLGFLRAAGQAHGQRQVTVMDNGTLHERRGSLNVDNEGNPTQKHHADREGHSEGLHGRQAFGAPDGAAQYRQRTGESDQHIPMPRMTNTYMLAGDDLPEDIIKSVKRGLYAVNFGGGQVDITNGKFVFAASEAYLIEDGKITAPVKDATLIGNGPDVLTRVSMVGNDLQLDEGVGTCGKDGQSVPVGVGIPTLKMTA